MEFDQTKQRRHRQWYVEGALELGWAILMPQAERFSKAAGYHGAESLDSPFPLLGTEAKPLSAYPDMYPLMYPLCIYVFDQNILPKPRT